MADHEEDDTWSVTSTRTLIDFYQNKIDNSRTKIIKIKETKLTPQSAIFAYIRTESETIQALNNFAEQSAVCTKLIYFNATLLF